MKRLNVSVVLLIALVAGCQKPLTSPARSSGGDRFTFVTIGDNRSGEPIVQPQAYLDNIAQINKLDPQPEVVIIVGDFIAGYTGDDDVELELAREEWDEFDRVTKAIRAPVRLVPGNHDMWDQASHELFIERYGVTYGSLN